MAIIVHFQRTSEDETQVEYAFGWTREEMDRRLVVDKATSDFRPTDDRTDGQFESVAMQIARRFRIEGDWPKQGLLQA